MKKLIAFDQDDTINITKLPMDNEMAELFRRLLERFQVCIISGCDWEVMKTNDIEPLKRLNKKSNFQNYFLLPTTGTQFWHYIGEGEKTLLEGQIEDEGWKREYAHFLTEEQIKIIGLELEAAVRELGYWCEKPKGEIIENRGSQVTFSALGQWAEAEDKHNWDKDMSKRRAIVSKIEPKLSSIGVQVNIGGATSIDVTLPNIDKAYGMAQLMEQTGVKKEEILFIGDKLQPGGNDYPVKEFGIDTIEVSNCEETKWILKGILGINTN
ncbi:HAD-IIB family hydrolase [Lactococcus garvieae]|uniref:HAD-IIB family hydrolase n=1 Tax=Lactococcus garvieae TaxID=1363 RepID=UPI00254EABE0|nr:HAD-IIB family hydrolase [Lactococcus garvieae]